MPGLEVRLKLVGFLVNPELQIMWVEHAIVLYEMIDSGQISFTAFASL